MFIKGLPQCWPGWAHTARMRQESRRLRQRRGRLAAVFLCTGSRESVARQPVGMQAAGSSHRFWPFLLRYYLAPAASAWFMSCPAGARAHCAALRRSRGGSAAAAAAGRLRRRTGPPPGQGRRALGSRQRERRRQAVMSGRRRVDRSRRASAPGARAGRRCGAGSPRLSRRPCWRSWWCGGASGGLRRMLPRRRPGGWRRCSTCCTTASTAAHS